MNKFAIIGDPVSHSLSPEMHNYILSRLDLKGDYGRIQVKKADLNQFIQRLRSGEFLGINVTLPHKEPAAGEVDELTPEAKRLGAVNCIRVDEGRLIGYNTDVTGFRKMLKLNDIDLNQKTCVILGAGGAARAVTAAVLDGNLGQILITNRTLARAHELGKWAQGLNTDTEIRTGEPEELSFIDLAGAVIINTTPAGMWPQVDLTPIPAELITRGQTLIDVIYNPVMTRFLELGLQAGARTVPGMDMFVSQGFASQDVWWQKDVSSLLSASELKKYLMESEKPYDG